MRAVIVTSFLIVASNVVFPAVVLPANGSDVQLQSDVDRDVAQVADPIQWVLRVTAPEGTKVVFPQWGQRLAEFQIQGEPQFKADLPSEAPDRRTWLTVVALDSLASGEFTIPSVEIQYRVPDAVEFQTLRSDPIPIRITSLLEDRVDVTEFRDVKPAVDLQVPPKTSSAWVWWSVGATCVLGLATCLFLFRRRSSETTAVNWASYEIDQLASAFRAGEIGNNAAFAELADVVDEFIGINRSESTEAFSQRDHQSTQPEQPERPGFLKVAEDVKFANLPVTPQQVQEAITQARNYVHSLDGGKN